MIPPEMRKPLLWSFLYALGFTAAGFVLLGFPGALIYEGSRYSLNFIFGSVVVRELSGDSAWPTVIMVSLIWPWSIVLGTFIAWKVDSQSEKFSQGRTLIVSGTILLSCLVLPYMLQNSIA